MVERDGHCPLVLVEDDLGHLGVDNHIEILEGLHAVTRIPDEGLGRGAAGAPPNVALGHRETCLSSAIDINIGIAKHFGRL